jgi:hypothetical protein
MAGFTSAEGCFMILIMNTKRSKGVIVEFIFQLVQHSRDEQLMRSLVKYFDGGFVTKYKDAYYYRIRKFDDIKNKIIPFFDKHPVHGVKKLNYLDFCKAAELMNNKAHLTEEGLDLIRQIKANMNKGRADS